MPRSMARGKSKARVAKKQKRRRKGRRKIWRRMSLHLRMQRRWKKRRSMGWKGMLLNNLRMSGNRHLHQQCTLHLLSPRTSQL
jgi:hypothetical protein